MNEYRITLTRQAHEDILAIGDYISYILCQPDTSHKFIKGLRISISQLKTFPYKFPLVPYDISPDQEIRYLPYKNYYIFYTVDEYKQLVIVLRIGYKKRNWQNLLT